MEEREGKGRGENVEFHYPLLSNLTTAPMDIKDSGTSS